MEDVIEVKGEYYIRALTSRVEDRTRVLKDGETFGVFDRYGDIQLYGLGEQGLYHDGTRHLSRLELRVGGRRPLLLSSTVKNENDLFTADLTNPDLMEGDDLISGRGDLHLFRSKFLWQGACYERIRLSNYGLNRVALSLRIHFDADFADIFEVRGITRAERGRRLNDRADLGTVVLAYEGLDGRVRTTRIECFPPPQRTTPSLIDYAVEIVPHETTTINLSVHCEERTPAAEHLPYDRAFVAASTRLEAIRARQCEIDCSNDRVNEWIERSISDLNMMISTTPHGSYPYAGVPWYSTVFGRDGIITALQVLWLDPELARGVLTFLAAAQATTTNPGQDAEPGKILHELRGGEMAALGEVPFGRYYGSVDSTPLFVMLAAAYYDRTGDLDLVRSIWPNIERALGWIENYGDRDGDGFVEYMRHTPTGLVHQGWKDSQDSVSHADGRLAEPPIALCEVQGYVYAAFEGAADLAEALGRTDQVIRFRTRAAALRERFEHEFWLEDLSTYALALDRDKQPCRVRSSNPGHCLFTGMVREDRARRAAATLLQEEMFSGWGVRTLGAAEVRYNPMSYHNGSVWPHDNSIIAAGLARYRLKDLAMRILSGLYDASLFVDLHRLPELVCGFHRRPGEGPTLYPVACAPQAWASGAPFLMLQACLGLSIDGPRRQVRCVHPVLPEVVERLRIRNLKVGEGSVDLAFDRHPFDVSLNVLRRTGDVQVIVMK
ncbi:MAG: amylo-alpha-1,6-glucosidase [Acidobacteria bacterium]|nr:amylo-alpha-1,6-glucosidase [Acidobacteriota bacterium]